jgi:hypothetical protein
MRHAFVEEAIETAAALALLAAEMAQAFGFASSGEVGESQTFLALPILQDQGGAVLDTLARITCRAGRLRDFGFLERLPYGLPSGSRFFYVGPEPRGDEILPLMALRSSGVTVEAFVTDSADGPTDGIGAAGLSIRRISGEGHD